MKKCLILSIFFNFLFVNVKSSEVVKPSENYTVATLILKFLESKNANVIYGLVGSGTVNFDWAFAKDRRPFQKSDESLANQLKNISYKHVSSEMFGAFSAGAFGKMKKSVLTMGSTLYQQLEDRVLLLL